MPWSYRCRTMDDVLVLAARADAARVERAYAVLTELFGGALPCSRLCWRPPRPGKLRALTTAPLRPFIKGR
ncbi:hypothetical protein GCM10012278_08170 [Nonomuraea glycinis]|uniref:Uncharacterized protein n=1 Tax=Nonomuraea glycinis TaxID=2047744 RepID=A0A918A1I3_9ACTN|nr:hypothetical protein GCM10012278_08170 [Nonomuraea glycinis]